MKLKVGWLLVGAIAIGTLFLTVTYVDLQDKVKRASTWLDMSHGRAGRAAAECQTDHDPVKCLEAKELASEYDSDHAALEAATREASQVSKLAIGASAVLVCSIMLVIRLQRSRATQNRSHAT